MARKKSRSKERRAKDPFAEREARRYEHPIPSREAIIALLNEQGELLKESRVAELLGLSGERDLDALRRRLNAMLRAGQLIKNRREGYGIAEKLDLTPGRVIGHPDGYGFVVPDAGGDDYYLNPRQMRRVLNGDRVLVSLAGIDRRGRKEGAIVEILERANSHLVGRYQEESGIRFVVADEKRIAQEILIPDGAERGATPGDFVYVEITEQPDARRQPVGRVLDVLGRNVNAPLAVELAIRSHQLPFEFPEDVLATTARIPDHVTEADLEGRRDLRKLPLVTIDGADAKDFDDAVFCARKRGGGFRLVVAIADVSHYVEAGRAIDREAELRATSAYFPNRVVPMLPESLSNGICSLKPHVDRLCMACEMHLDEKGKVTRSRFVEAVMHSHARLTYGQAWACLDEAQSSAPALPKDVLESLQALHALFRALRKRRAVRGAIDFESTEVGFRFDEQGEVDAIVPKPRNDAHKIIEECMILANVQAARWLEKQKLPAPFRVHARPPERKLDDLRVSLAELGLHVPDADRLEPKAFARILDTVKGRPDRGLVEALVLRAQSLAVYQTSNDGHFGLALEAYAHFTSPIRRYADLLVHRAIRHGLRRGRKADFRYTAEAMESLSSHCSMADRRAEEASRDVDDRLKCRYMERHIGEEFEGLITGVTSFGLFVEMEGLYTSGLAHVTMLPNDYYHFDAATHTLTGERRHRTYRLADRVRVQVIRVDPDEREIDLKVVADA